MTTKRNLKSEIEDLNVGGDNDIPPVFVEYGPNGEVVTPGLFGVKTYEENE